MKQVSDKYGSKSTTNELCQFEARNGGSNSSFVNYVKRPSELEANISPAT